MTPVMVDVNPSVLGHSFMFGHVRPAAVEAIPIARDPTVDQQFEAAVLARESARSVEVLTAAIDAGVRRRVPEAELWNAQRDRSPTVLRDVRSGRPVCVPGCRQWRGPRE
jgi:hypothetical protein